MFIDVGNEPTEFEGARFNGSDGGVIQVSAVMTASPREVVVIDAKDHGLHIIVPADDIPLLITALEVVFNEWEGR